MELISIPTHITMETASRSSLFISGFYLDIMMLAIYGTDLPFTLQVMRFSQEQVASFIAVVGVLSVLAQVSVVSPVFEWNLR